MLVALMFAPFAAGSGHPSCPCIDPWAHGLKLNGNAPQAVVAGCEIKRSDSGACFPMSYGSTGCDSHSATADAECMVTTSEAPTWCSSRWCYVDATNCFRPSQSSIYFADARLPASILTNWTGSNQLTFSYETCDNLDQYSSSSEGAIFFLRNFIASRPGGKLRVSFPNDYMGGYYATGNLDYPLPRGGPKVVPGTGVQGTNRSGAVVVFMHELLQRCKIPWEEVPIPAASWDYSRSSFTSCTHAVALGEADMCWANVSSLLL